MNLPLDIESCLKKIFPFYDLNGIFFMFYKHNWNILNKSQVYSSPKMFFLSLATCADTSFIISDESDFFQNAKFCPILNIYNSADDQFFKFAWVANSMLTCSVML